MNIVKKRKTRGLFETFLNQKRYNNQTLISVVNVLKWHFHNPF